MGLKDMYAWGGSIVQTHRMYLLSCGEDEFEWGYFGAAGYLFLVCEMPVPDCWKGALISGPLRGLEAW